MSQPFTNSYPRLKPYSILILLIITILLTIIAPVFAVKPNSIFTPYTKVTLKNGLTVIVKEVHSSPVATIDIRVATGAKNDLPGESGISHFFEHMLFKGTKNRKVGEIAAEIKSVGGNLNAETSLDTTHYYVMVPSKYIDLALNVEADAIMNSSFDTGEIDRERNVILEEIRMRQDNLQGTLSEQMIQKLFAGTPYANIMSGTPDTLKNINRDTFLAYYRKYYVPNNMVLAVVGDVDTTKVINRVKQLFKDFKPNKIASSRRVQMPVLKEISRIEIQKNLKQKYLYFGFPAPGLHSKDGNYLEVLKILLGGCRSSRLLALTNNQFVNTIQADYYVFKDTGLFTIYVETQSAPEDVESRVRDVLREIAENGITYDELSKAKALLFSQITSNGESSYLLANVMSYYEVYGSLADAANYEKSIRAITKENILQAARKYLDPDHFVLMVVKPKEAK